MNQQTVSNSTTTELTQDQLNAAYSNAVVGFKVLCSEITAGSLMYIKAENAWYSIPLGTV
ncbi:MAG: hypothetical protein V4708_16425 [Bacteroidota bacterium]